jgi:molecular chaperone GrpE
VNDRATDPEDVLAAAPGIGAELELGEHEDADELARSDDGADADGLAESAEMADERPEPDEVADADELAEAGEQPEPDYLGDLQRVSAEFANFRKQTEKRNLDLMARASQRLAEALLPVLDACDAAALQGIEGVEQIHSQLMSVLGNEGLEVIADTEEPFDPNRHDAVMTEPADEGDEGTVVAEMLRTGYAWKGRVIRPAMVKVRG